ncbi:unnamed protein product [Leuciscus chuanchicus]
MLCYLNRCNSIMVESGCFMIYEQPNYNGLQFLVRKGEYPEFESWLGKNDSVCSCRVIPMIIFYEDRNFQGRHHESSSDCADLHPYFTQCNSIRVESGCFMVYEHPNYMGQQYFLRRGEYSDCQRMVGFSNYIRSCRMIPMYNGNYRMRLYDQADMGGQMIELTEDCPNIMDHFHTSDIHSCHVMDGHWLLYEQPNFRGRMYYLRPGRSYECSNDCTDLHTYFSRCNSIRVESGCFMIYERPNYMGHQYFMKRGEYSDYQRWMGFSSCIRSCRQIPMYRGPYRMRIYEKADYGGHMMEFMDDCPCVSDRFHHRHVYSCNVMNGYWIFYEYPNYRGRQYFLKPGEYRRYRDWCATCAIVGSFRRVNDY